MNNSFSSLSKEFQNPVGSLANLFCQYLILPESLSFKTIGSFN